MNPLSLDPLAMNPLALSERHALPADLLALYDALPRDAWPEDPGFHPLASFWLDRHLGFRHLLTTLGNQARALESGDLDPQLWARNLSRHGSQLVDELIGHHQIEDDAYFPQMALLEPKLNRGFEMLDADHHALDGLLDGFVSVANAALSAGAHRNSANALLTTLPAFQTQLIRHLQDEEDLIIPVILKHALR
jgi:hemerythrin-like domain-containing protein